MLRPAVNLGVAGFILVVEVEALIGLGVIALIGVVLTTAGTLCRRRTCDREDGIECGGPGVGLREFGRHRDPSLHLRVWGPTTS